MASLRPDILAVQEIEPIEGRLLFAGDLQPTFRDRCAPVGSIKRGLGMFSYTETTIRPVDGPTPFSGIRRYEASRKGLSFNVVGVWTWDTRSAKTKYRQAHEGLQLHEQWIRERPTIVLGDFNANASFKGKNWAQLLELLEGLGLASAYHSHYSNEPFGGEKMATHFHKGKATAGFHLDYCFVPREWTQHIESVTVGGHAEWHEFSDHIPLVVDLSIG